MPRVKLNKTKYTGIFSYETKTKGKMYAIRVRYQDDLGNWKEKTEQGFGSIKSARSRKAELEDAIHNESASSFDNDNITFKEWGEKYFELMSPTWSDETVRNFKQIFHKHLSQLHPIPLSKLTRVRYQEHVNYLLFDKDYAESTVKHGHRIAMSVLNSAVDHDVLLKNKLKKVKIYKLAEPKEKFLEADELARLDDVAKEHLKTMRYACYVLMRIGWRRSEVLGLIYDGVKVIDENTVDVSVKEARGESKERAAVKSKSSYRTNRLKGGYAIAIIKAVELSKQIHVNHNIVCTGKSRVFVNKKAITSDNIQS